MLRRVPLALALAGLLAATSARAADKPPEAPQANARPPEWLDVSAGLAVASRHFDYRDPIGSGLRRYDVDGVPMIALAAEVYPYASHPILGAFGLVGSYAESLGFTSATSGGASIPTKWLRFDGGLRARVRISRVELGLSVVYGREDFAFGNAGATALARELPAVAYGFVRPALDLRVPLGRFEVRARAGYLQVVDAGDVASRMRGGSVAGVEASLGLGVRVAGPLAARIGATYARFFYAFAPAPGDAFVAGGALDQILRGELALALSL